MRSIEECIVEEVAIHELVREHQNIIGPKRHLSCAYIVEVLELEVVDFPVSD
jgi:hypothetical protein